jgi:hypothetical protein
MRLSTNEDKPSMSTNEDNRLGSHWLDSKAGGEASTSAMRASIGRQQLPLDRHLPVRTPATDRGVKMTDVCSGSVLHAYCSSSIFAV